MYLRSSHPSDSRRGVVLLAVLVLVVILSLAAYEYSEWVMAEFQLADSQRKATQARELANSGIHYAAALLSNRQAYINELHGNPYDNPDVFQHVAVPLQTVSGRPGYFSLVTMGPGNFQSTGTYRFGVSDESGKLNVNALLRLDRRRRDAASDNPNPRATQALMNLPGMTEELAASILDWLDTDDSPRSGGAENDYYSTLSTPYQAKNGPIDSLEELLLVRGMTPEILFGNDINRNGVLDPGEDDVLGESSQGLSAYLTVYSRELNVDNDGNPRIFLRQEDADVLEDQLTTAVGQELTEFILAARGGVVRLGSMGEPPQEGARPRRPRSLFDLVNCELPGRDGAPGMPSPLNDRSQMDSLLPVLLDKATFTQEMELTPRINVNTAPLEVLLAIPRLEPADAEAIVLNQPVLSTLGGPDPVYETPTWLITRANLPADVVRRIEPYITTRSLVYRVQALGYYAEGGPVARVEAVIDTNNGRPRIVYWRNLSELGRGFDFLQGQRGNALSFP